jgi:hypothetical protein
MEVGPKLKLSDLKKQSAVKLRDGRRHHAALAAVTSDAEAVQALDPVQHPLCDRTGYQQNRELAIRISDAVEAVKTTDEHGPHFLLAWRLYPNEEHPRWQAKSPHYCGCACGGLAPLKKGKKKKKKGAAKKKKGAAKKTKKARKKK